MKPLMFVLFFTIFFALYGLVNYYIFIRGLQALPQNSSYRVYYCILFIVLALSFFIGRTLENYWLNPCTKTFIWIGAFWLSAMLYLILGIILFDLLRLLNHFFGIFPQTVVVHYQVVKQYTALGLMIAVLLILGFGYLNAVSPKIQHLHLKVAKKSKGMKTLHIVSASDIHLGSIVGKKRFDSIVALINNLDPDVVLLPGDIVDEDIAPVIKENLGESLRNLRPRYGLYAVTGNHEYIGGVEDACKYLTENGVTVLRDRSVLVNSTLYLIGREDRSANRFQNRSRESLANLMTGIDTSYPIVLMDHQPFQIEEASRYGVDLQLSGHTHHGQLWPLNAITAIVYEMSWGYRLEGRTHYYVSCGVGTWGPPVRTGNHPEVIDIILEFD